LAARRIGITRVAAIENPNPAVGTNNWYTEDGYGTSYNAGNPPPYYMRPCAAAAHTRYAGQFAGASSSAATVRYRTDDSHLESL
jgi:hypothetical protein